MFVRNLIATTLFLVVVAGLGVGAFMTYEQWYPRLFPNAARADTEVEEHDDEEITELEISPQAKKNIGLVLKPVQLQDYNRSLRIPGVIVPEPGKSRLSVSTPITGIVESIAIAQGETVKPGDKLFTLHIHSHDVQKMQADLFKAVKELKINKEQQDRIKEVTAMGAIAEAQLLELQYEQRRLEVTLKTLETSMRLHRMSDEQIEQIKNGKFIDKLVIRAPDADPAHSEIAMQNTSARPMSTQPPPFYEVLEIKVKLGDQVEPGEVLCTLGDHQWLVLEGRVFRDEIPLVEEAVRQRKRVQAEVLDASGNRWTVPDQELTIQYMDHDIDVASQTVGVYVRIQNQFTEYVSGGKKYRIWNYRPGQRIYLNIPVEQFRDVFVLPIEGVVREGPEAYVFVQNGKLLVRRAVHVLYQDQRNVVIANDGSIVPGNVVAHNAAAQLQRALQAKAEGGGGHEHHHHHH